MVTIKVVTIGHMPSEFDLKKISSLKSREFTITPDIENYTINNDSDGDNWEFSDENLQSQLPAEFNEDFLIAIVNVPIEQNWYSRRLNDNKVVFSFYETKDILNFYNIPLENIIYRLLYAYTLLFKRSKRSIPSGTENTDFTHDETRGCLFDMNGIKRDIVYSCHDPIICDSCVEKMRTDRVPENTINRIKKEIRKIKKPLFFRVSDFIKMHPIISLIISVSVALALGIIGSLLANIIYETFIRK